MVMLKMDYQSIVDRFHQLVQEDQVHDVEEYIQKYGAILGFHSQGVYDMVKTVPMFSLLQRYHFEIPDIKNIIQLLKKNLGQVELFQQMNVSLAGCRYVDVESVEQLDAFKLLGYVPIDDNLSDAVVLGEYELVRRLLRCANVLPEIWYSVVDVEMAKLLGKTYNNDDVMEKMFFMGPFPEVTLLDYLVRNGVQVSGDLLKRTMNNDVLPPVELYEWGWNNGVDDDFNMVVAMINMERLPDIRLFRWAMNHGNSLSSLLHQTPRVDQVEMLLRLGADPHEKCVFDGKEYEPLNYHITKHRLEVAEFLLRQGIRPTGDKWSIGHNHDLFKMLVKYGVPVSVIAKNTVEPVEMVFAENFKPVIRNGHLMELMIQTHWARDNLDKISGLLAIANSDAIPMVSAIQILTCLPFDIVKQVLLMVRHL